MPAQPHPQSSAPAAPAGPAPGARGRVAVVGSGVAGLTAAYLLQRRYDVLLFEADARLGGHAHTHDVPGSGRSVPVDSGFIVHNERTYPHLLRLFGELDVATQQTEHVDERALRDVRAGVRRRARARAGCSPRRGPRCGRNTCACCWRSSASTAQARQMLDGTHTGDGRRAVTLDAFLAAGGYSRLFNDHFMLPLVRRSGPPAPHGRPLPGAVPFKFLNHHGMLAVTAVRRSGAPSSAGRALRRARRQEPDGGAPVDAGPGGRRAPPTGCASATTPTPSTRSTASSSPRTPTRRCGCWPTRRRPRARSWAPSRTR